MAKSYKTRSRAEEGVCARLWRKNQSMVLMIVAQFISSLMAVAAKLLQTTTVELNEDGPLSTNQILIIMMSITFVLSWIYMVLVDLPQTPFGPREMWSLLTLRSISGVFGIWGFYYSLRFLPLSEAVVINFLAPMVAAVASALLLKTPFSVVQRIAGTASFTGVILVSQPWHYFDKPSGPSIPHGTLSKSDMISPNMPVPDANSSLEHASGVGAALVGVVGGAIAYVTMTRIGNRLHPSMTVCHFAFWTVLFTGIGSAIIGLDDFRMPNDLEWILLIFLGIFGLGLHLLMSASLQMDKTNRALNMVYTQIVFTLIMNKAVWDVTPDWMSLGGGSMILSSVFILVIFQHEKNEKAKRIPRDAHERDVHEEEEIEMMINEEGKENPDGVDV